MSLDRRGFLGRAMGLAGLAAVGGLVIPRAYVWPSVEAELPAVAEPPKIYQPNQPAIIAATSVGRPVLEATIRGFSLNATFNRMDVTSYADPIRQYIQPLDHETDFHGHLTDVAVHYAAMDDLVTRKLRMYLFVEDE